MTLKGLFGKHAPKLGGFEIFKYISPGFLVLNVALFAELI